MLKMLILSILASVSSFALAKEDCGKVFEKTVGEVKTKHWEAIENFYKNYEYCDDAAYSSGLSGSIMNLLADRWSDLNIVEQKFKDPGFKKFVLNKIDVEVSASEPQAAAILAQARLNCSKGHEKICSEILDTVSTVVIQARKLK